MKRFLSLILPLLLVGVFANAVSSAQAASTTYPGVNAKGELTWRGNGTSLWFTGTPSLSDVVTDHNVYKFNTTTGAVERTFSVGATGVPYGIMYQGPNVWVAVGDQFTPSPKLVKINGSNVLETFILPISNQNSFSLLASDGSSVWASSYNTTPSTVVRVDSVGNVMATHDFPANEGSTYKILHDNSTYGYPVILVFRSQNLVVLRADTLAIVETIAAGSSGFGTNDDVVNYAGPGGSQTGYIFNSDGSGQSAVSQFGPAAFGYFASSSSRSLSLAVDTGVSPGAIWAYNRSIGQFEAFRAYCNPTPTVTVAPSATDVNRFLIGNGTLWATTTSGTLEKITALPAYPASCAAPVEPGVTITVPPTVTQLSTTSVRINWTTAQAADSVVDYGLNQAYALGSVPNASLDTAHQITLMGLTAGQTYHYRVKSRAAGFTDAVSSDQTFATTLATITISNARVTFVGAFSVNVSWQTSVSTSSNFASIGFSTASATNGTTHTLPVPLNGLASSTPYTIMITSSESGYATAQTTLSFTTLAPYTVSVAPTGTQNVTQGSLASFTITVVPASDFSFASLALATNPALANSTQTFSPTEITPPQLSSTLTFTTAALSIGSTYNVPVTVTCNSCNPVYTATVTPSFSVGAVAPACQLALTPPSTNVMSGTSGALQLQLTSLNGFASQVGVTNISPNPAYPTTKLAWNTFMGGGSASQQTVSIDTSNVAQGSYQVKFHAKDPNSSVACDSQAVMVTVGPPDFTITAVPVTQTVSKNQFADYVFQVRPIGTFNGSVQVSILPPNAGTAWPAGTYSPSSGSFGNAFGDMSVRVNTTTMAEGTYWAKVRATSGSITHEIDPVELIVGPPGMCDDGVTADQSCSTTQQWCDLSVSDSVSTNCVTNGIKCTFQCAAPQTCNTTSGACVGDTTPPVISQLQCIPDATAATVTWTTDEPANSEVLWRPASVQPPYPGVLSTDPLPPGTTSHVVPIQSLNPSTQYFVKVKSTDGQDNTASSAEIPCTTLATADTQPPVVQITFPPSGSTIVSSTAVRAMASDNNVVVRVEFTATGPNGTTGSINVDTTSPYEMNWSVSGLPSGTYALTAKATDAAGNIGVSPQVNVVVNNDTSKPVITNFLPRRTAPSQYTVTWTTNEPATSWVYYCVEPVGGGACTYNQREPVNSGTALSTSHRIVLDSLLLNRNYRLTPISCDAAGNCNNPKPF